MKEGCFSERLDAYANTVRKLGNVGTHNFGEKITSEDVFQSLNHLMPILEWYFVEERPEAGLTLDGPQRSPGGNRFKPIDAGPAQEAQVRGALIPKGLRAFDAADSDSFLQLLPGPCGRDGLPQSIRFWKQRIDAADELTFTVGVIYGPSGCGKSSLVKAGLLPRLSNSVVSMYVEATPDGTETRILNVLRKRFPELPAGLDLPQTVARLRQGEGLRANQKALLVIDQFEQWLHARRTRAKPSWPRPSGSATASTSSASCWCGTIFGSRSAALWRRSRFRFWSVRTRPWSIFSIGSTRAACS